MSDSSSPAAGFGPGPQDASEAERWTHTARRRRLLYSRHEDDVRDAIKAHVGGERAKVWGHPDRSANPYLSLWEQSARMYAEPPEIRGMGLTVQAAAAAGLWSLMQRVQRDTLGLREMAVAVELVDGRPVYYPMFPDQLEGRAAPGDPGQPVVLTHTREEPGLGWVRVTWSIEDPANPYYEARKVRQSVTADQFGDEEDVSRQVLGGEFHCQAYPFRDASGAPIMPVVFYHAAETASLWDPYTGQEIVEGSILLGIYLTYFGHVIRTSAWAQRYAAGVDLGVDEVNADAGDASPTREIIPDPSRVLLLRADDEQAGQIIIGQWAPPVDPLQLIQAIRIYADWLVQAAGLRTDVTKQSSDIRSGYSLAVARDAIREAQRVYEPLFARADTRLLTVTAQLLGQPVEDLRITYRGLAVSPQERRALIDEVTSLRDAKLMSRVEAWQRLHPGASDSEARTALAEIDAESKETAA